MDRWADFLARGIARHGVVTLADAVDCGIPPATLQRRVAREEWPALHAGVWALPGAPDSPLRASAAALVASPDHSMLARRSAAWLWGLRDTAPPRTEVLVPHGESRPRRDGIVTLQSRSLRPVDGRIREGLRVTSPARTIADLARVTSSHHLAEIVVRARQRGLVDLPELAAQVAVMRKAPGIPRLRAVVDMLSGERVDSMLEHDVRVSLANARLPVPAPEPVWIGSGRGSVQIDIAWPDRKVGIEVDSFAHHSSHEDLARDHRKTNVTAAAGWTLLRVGYLRRQSDRAAFIAEVRAVLTAHSMRSQ